MKVDWPKSGHYVVAVSGGVDSMTLLHLLQSRPELKLAVAHFDHGIRSDSADDRQLAEEAAKNYGPPFIFAEGRLGPGASEAAARAARYAFLRKVVEAHGAEAIITAHHQDDVLETAILNMLRGTGRKGLTSLSSRQDVIRPLLKVPKKELAAYAKQHGLKWREDPSNQNVDYMRNYVRHKLLARFSEQDKAKLVSIIAGLTVTNRQLDEQLFEQLSLQSQNGELDRQWFNNLPHQVAREVLAAWLRANQTGFDRKALERLVVAAKTAKPGKVFPVAKQVQLSITAKHLALVHKER
jgi:tRNA(Ile)-lysidine synthase